MVLCTLVLLVFSFHLLPARGDINFNKGIAYLLIEDSALAQRHFNVYFNLNPNPTLRNGFKLLVEGNYSDATDQFKNFLDLNHRSTIALLGIALSTSTMTVSNTRELLKRATRLNPGYSPAYLSLGMEYLKIKNYPAAESNFRRALRFSNVPEYKILLGRLYLDLNKPELTLRLLQPEADRAPDNFYFNYLTARAFLQLNRLEELGQYIQTALEVNPTNNDARLLTAKYYLNQDDARRAGAILKGMKPDDYNEDYMKTYGHALVKLKDKKARKYLYEVFSRNGWDKDINRLLGLFHLWMDQKGTVQNWIYRTLLSGMELSRLKELFPGNYTFPEYKFLPFFDVKQVEWLSEDTLLVVATRKSGERDRIFILDLKRMRIVQTMTYSGRMQEMFIAGNRKNLIFSTTARANESVYLYAMGLTGRILRPRLIFRRPLGMPSVLVGFNSTGTLAYITDHRINKVAFESPFAQVSQYGKKAPVYPTYPFPIFRYNFTTRRLARLKEVGQVEVAPPVDAVRKYALLYSALLSNAQVQRLVEKGQQLDLTSSEMVKTYFAKDLSAFIIYMSDLKNAFYGVLWDHYNNLVLPIDEVMFLGAGKYAELSVLDFNPRKKELLVLTKNKKELILYNYKTHLHICLAVKAEIVHYDREKGMIYVLNERNPKTPFAGSGLRVISLKPYFNKSVGTQKGLTNIITDMAGDTESAVYFSTIHGEIVRMDDEYKFSYVGPSLEGSLNVTSPSTKKTAAFINGKLWIIE